MPVIDTPHPQVPDMQRDAIAVLDLDGCNVATFVMALAEDEADGVSHRFEAWPLDFQARMSAEIVLFVERNPGASIRGFTQGVRDGCCVLAIHWKPKGAA